MLRVRNVLCLGLVSCCWVSFSEIAFAITWLGFNPSIVTFAILIHSLLDRLFSWDYWDVTCVFSWAIDWALLLKSITLTTCKVVLDRTLTFSGETLFSSRLCLLLVEQIDLSRGICITCCRSLKGLLWIVGRDRISWTSHVVRIWHRSSILILFCSFTEATTDSTEPSPWPRISIHKSTFVLARLRTLAMG